MVCLGRARRLVSLDREPPDSGSKGRVRVGTRFATKTGACLLFLGLTAGLLSSCVADAAPGNVVASAGNAQASVSWSAPPEKSGEITIGYNVMAIVNNVTQSPVRFNSTATTQVITGLTNGVSYEFAVQAISVYGESAWSIASSAVSPSGCNPNLLTEDFHNNTAGWTLGPEWNMGSAAASTGHQAGNPDPSADHTPTADNGVAGTIIGGNPNTNLLHGPYSLESPPINATGHTSLTLDFWRWLNSDYPPYSDWRVEVFNGTAWTVVLSNSAATAVTADSAWTHFTVDVTPYLNPAFRVKFSYSITQSGVYVMSGWNLDDITVSGNCA
jgi:Fibronectin type III domain